MLLPCRFAYYSINHVPPPASLGPRIGRFVLCVFRCVPRLTGPLGIFGDARKGYNAGGRFARSVVAGTGRHAVPSVLSSVTCGRTESRRRWQPSGTNRSFWSGADV